jgi:hypothetical protein
MNRITSPYLPIARKLLDAFANAATSGAARLSPEDEAVRQRSPAGWAVPRNRLVAELRDRLDGKTLPHQRGTSYCGCSAFLYCVLEDRRIGTSLTQQLFGEVRRSRSKARANRPLSLLMLKRENR